MASVKPLDYVSVRTNAAPNPPVQSVSVKERVQEEEEDDQDTVNPMLQLLYDFCTEPRSSKFSFYWNSFMAWLVLISLLKIGLESCDGPNWYTDRRESASYPFLLTSGGYWTVTLFTQIPLVIDDVGRFTLLLCVLLDRRTNRRLLDALKADKFVLLLLFCDIVGVLPFFAYCTHVTMSGNTVFFLTLIQLLSTCRIMRITKDIPSVWAIRIALSRSMQHLVLPFFVFFIFNVTAAVILYFVEPCYNVQTCPWHDLFEASFYSVVTMTTTGYGNQTPEYALLRFFACFVMVFGAVYMSMPLAIIGNEYSEAWEEVVSTLRDQHKRKLETAAKRLNELFKSSVRLMPVIAVNAAVHKMVAASNAENGDDSVSDKKSGKDTKVDSTTAIGIGSVHSSMLVDHRLKVVELMSERLQAEYHNLLCRSAMLESHKQILPLIDKCHLEAIKSTRLTPMLLMYLTELRGWLVALRSGSTFVIDQLCKDMKSTGVRQKAKRLSMIGIGGPAERDAELPSGDDSAKSNSGRAKEGRDSDNEDDDEDGQDDTEHITFLQMMSEFLCGKKASRHETEYSIMMAKLKKDPTNFRNRIWEMLEIHNSSREAKAFQYITLVLIVLSVLLLFTETLSSWNGWSNGSPICGAVLKKYCHDKHNNTLDPGCFAFDSDGIVTDNKLRYDCDDDDCFAMAMNFGSEHTYLKCPDDPTTESYPFQSQNQLIYTYGNPITFTSRPMMHRLSAICLRNECNPPQQSTVNGERIFYVCEIVITLLFSSEVLARIAVADSVMRYFSSAMNMFDLFAIFPFFIEISGVDSSGKKGGINFGISSSSPENYFLVLARAFKIFRLYKLVRFFRATKVFTDTARKCINQMLGIMSMMLCLVILFAIMLYQVEKGESCFIGDPGCTVPKALEGTYHIGDRISLNKFGDISQFPDVFDGLWFSFVTLTTTGYGDMVPVTNTGQIMTVFLMLAGSCYLSMPLTVASSTFYEVHEQFLKKTTSKHKIEQQQAEAQVFASKAAKDTAWKRRLQNMRTSLSMSIQSLDSFLSDLQEPSASGINATGSSTGASEYSSSAKLKAKAEKHSKSSLLQRATVIINDARIQTGSIGRDLEALALTSTTLYNKQSKDNAKTSQTSTLIVC